jgi:hypothetical protein
MGFIAGRGLIVTRPNGHFRKIAAPVARTLRTTDPDVTFLALSVSAGTARFRQLSEAMRKSYARREPFSV